MGALRYVPVAESHKMWYFCPTQGCRPCVEVERASLFLRVSSALLRQVSSTTPLDVGDPAMTVNVDECVKVEQLLSLVEKSPNADELEPYLQNMPVEAAGYGSISCESGCCWTWHARRSARECNHRGAEVAAAALGCTWVLSAAPQHLSC
eukprot:2308154-Amphidinium_carterae.1